MIYARNNVWAGTNYALNNYNETQPIDFDYDDLYTRRSLIFQAVSQICNPHMYRFPGS